MSDEERQRKRGARKKKGRKGVSTKGGVVKH